MAKELNIEEKRKKKEELYVLKSLLNILGENDSFSIESEEQERPDFVLLSKTGERIGVELTTFYDEHKKNIKSKKSRLYNKLLNVLKQNNRYFKIDKDADLSSKEIYQYNINLRPFFVYNYTQKELEDLSQSFNSWLEKDELNSESNNESNSESNYATFSKSKVISQQTILDLNQIYVSYVPFSNGMLSVIDEHHPLHKPINEKNLKLNDYKSSNPDIKQWWLCINLEMESSIQACSYKFSNNYNTQYDRVFLIDSFRDIVYEIK